MLSLTDVTKDYGPTRALDSASMSLAAGERLCLVGPNGAGKTTLMRIVVGMALPTMGQVRLLGKDPVREHEVRRRLGYLPDTPFLYDKLSSHEHLQLHASLYDLPQGGVLRGGAELLDTLEMGSAWDQRVETFSLGMRKKLALVLALVHRPTLLVLDEPLNGLDPKSSKIMGDILTRLALEEGRGIILSTHATDFAARFATRIGTMERGRLELGDPPKRTETTDLRDLLST